MAANTLKEFLVAIGFKVDEVQLKNFNDRIQKITERVLDLGQQFAITATGVSASVTRMASDMERLYFASQRTGTGAANIRAFGVAAQNAGLSVSEASGLIEGLSAKMRSLPAGMGKTLLAGYGIRYDKDAGQQIINMVNWAKEQERLNPIMGHVFASRTLAQFGIDETTLTNLEKSKTLQQDYINSQNQQKKSGLNLDKETENAHKFMDDMRQAMQRVEDLAMMFTSRLLPAGEKVVGWLNNLVSVAERADKATGGWSTIIGGLIATFGAMKIGMSLLRGITGGGRGGALGAAEGLARGASVFEIAEAIINVQHGMGGGLGNFGKLGKGARAAEEAEGGAEGIGNAEAMKNAKWALGGEEAVEAEGAMGVAAVAPEAAAGVAAIAWPVLIAAAATAAIAWVVMNPQKVGEAARAVVDWAKGAWEKTETAVAGAWDATKKFAAETAKDSKWTIEHPKEAVKVVKEKTQEAVKVAKEKTQEAVAATTNATSNWWAKVKQNYDLSGFDDNTIDLIAQHEGHAKGGYGSYKDIAGYQTTGFGHKIEKGEDNLIGKNLTEGAARSMLVTDISKFRDQMMPLIKNTKLNSHQRTALLDFAYNVGIGNFKKSTLLKDINAGDLEDASKEFLKWNKVQTQPGVWTVSKGVSERRQQDAELFTGHKVEMNQNATIIVQGGDPHTVAQKVKDSQQSLSNDLLRNTVTALDNGRPS